MNYSKIQSNKLVKNADIIKANKILKNNIVKTPLIYDFILSKKLNSKIFYKAENIQRTGSFKIRGAYNIIYNSILKD